MEFNSTTPALFAYLAIAVSAMRYGTYLWAIYKKEAKPHFFSYFNWGLVTAIGAYAQMQLQGGPSTWVLMVVSTSCFLIALLSLFVGTKNVMRSDWYAFIGGLLVIPVWLSTKSPFLALVLVVIIDVLSYYPTFRKSWRDPWEEPPVSFFWAGLRYFLMLFAVPVPTVQTLFYPLFLMTSDWGLALYVVWRRKVEGKKRIA